MQSSYEMTTKDRYSIPQMLLQDVYSFFVENKTKLNSTQAWENQERKIFCFNILSMWDFSEPLTS